MSFLDKLERRLGFIAIPGLIRAVVTLNALVFVLVYLNKGFDSYLALDIARIRAGEVWRLITYIFVPQMGHPLLVVVALWFLWFIGDGLERAWGPFRLTLYFLVGMIGTTVAAVLSNSQFSSQMLFTTLFFAFAHFYPEEIIYVFFILPLKIKWIAWAYAGYLFARLRDAIEFLPVGFHCGAEQLSPLLWTGSDSPPPAAQGGGRSAQAFRDSIAQ